MKRILIFLSVLILFALPCCKKPSIIIEGNFKEGAKKIIILDRLDIDKTTTIDSLRIRKNNTFIFKIFAEHPDLYILRNEEGKIINLLPSPGEKLLVEGSYSKFDKSYTVHGSQESEYVRQLVEKLSETRENLRLLDKEINEKVVLSPEQTEFYIQKQNHIIKDQRDFSIKFIIEHMKSLSSIYALYQKINPNQLVLGENKDIQYMKILADTLSIKFPDVPLVKSFVNDARNAEKRYYSYFGLQEKLNLAKNTLPDIELPDMKENLLKLSSLKGKIVLLYFWSPQSDICKKINAALLQTYMEYKYRGFEIYAVGISNDMTSWANSVIVDKLDWKNVILTDNEDTQIIRLYNVNRIPTNFLLSRDGEVLARDLYGAELNIWLDNLLK